MESAERYTFRGRWRDMEIKKIVAVASLAAAVGSVVAMFRSGSFELDWTSAVIVAVTLALAVVALVLMWKEGRKAKCDRCGRLVQKSDLVRAYKDKAWCRKCLGLDGGKPINTEGLPDAGICVPPPERPRQRPSL